MDKTNFSFIKITIFMSVCVKTPMLLLSYYFPAEHLFIFESLCVKGNATVCSQGDRLENEFEQSISKHVKYQNFRGFFSVP